MNTEIEIATAKRVGLGLGKVANVLDAHRKKVGDKEIYMGIAHINHCGSPMCFAGLYASITTSIEELGIMDYRYGKELIEKECGFNNGLKQWAMDNPELWGNENGINIFSGDDAFGISKYKTLTLDILIAHLRGVSARCAELETT